MILFVSYYEKSWNIGCFIDMYLLDNCTQIHYFENNHVYNLIIFKFKSVKILVIHYPFLQVTPKHLSYNTEPYLNLTSLKFVSHQKRHHLLYSKQDTWENHGQNTVNFENLLSLYCIGESWMDTSMILNNEYFAIFL